MSMVETKRKEVQEEGTRKWEANQRDKYNRSVRDLQFELALQMKQELQVKKTNRLHALEQTAGIEFYEQNLRRNGFGGAGDDDAKLDVTYEDGELFLQRIEDTVKRTAPTDGEIGDFTMQLKNRTKELRIARQEKVRRKRRMIVSQLAAGSAAAEQEEMEMLAAEERRLEAENAAEVENADAKAAAKQAKNEEIAARAKAERERIAQEAEEELRIFSEQQKMLAVDRDRDEEYAKVLELQVQRVAEKHARNEKLMSVIVFELVNEVMEIAESGDTMSSGQGSRRALTGTAGRPAVEIPDLLSEYVRQALDACGTFDGVGNNTSRTEKKSIFGQKKQLQLHDITAMDMWGPVVSTLSNIGLWTSESAVLLKEEHLVDTSISLNQGEERKQEPEVEVVGEDTSATDAPKPVPESDLAGPGDFGAISESQGECISGGEVLDHASFITDPFKIAPSTCADSHRLFVEALASRLGSQLEASSGPENTSGRVSTTSGISVDAASDEIAFLDNPVYHENFKWVQKPAGVSGDAAVAITLPTQSTCRTIVILGIESDPATGSRIWNSVSKWFQNKIAIWDIVTVLSIVKHLKAGGVDITVSDVVHALLGENVKFKQDCAGDAFNSIELSPQVKKVITELIVYYDKIMNYSEFVVRAHPQEVTDAPAPIPEAPFDNTTLAIIFFQMLWLRSTIFRVVENSPGVESICQNVVIAGAWRFHSDGCNRCLLSRVALWFSRGYTRLDLPETETTLIAAIAKETERDKFIQLPPGTKPAKAGKAPAKAAAKKGQIVEPLYDKESCISSVIWSTSNTLEYVGYQSAPMANAHISAEQEVIDFYCRPANNASSGDGKVNDMTKEKWGALYELISGLDGAVPIYPIIYSAAAKEATVVASNEATLSKGLESEEHPGNALGSVGEDSREVQLECPIIYSALVTVHISCPTLIALSEACAAVVLDTCGYTVPHVDDSTSDLLDKAAIVDSPPSEAPLETEEQREGRLKAVLIAALARISNLVNLRRSRLDLLDRVWLNHLSGSNVLDSRAVFMAIEGLCNLKLNELEFMGPLMMGLLLMLERLDGSFRKKASLLINKMKTSDPRWQSICVKYFDKLICKTGFSLTRDNVDDMVCDLGDVIDQRHFEWSQQADRLIEDATKEALAVVEYVADASCLLARASSNQLQRLHEGGKLLAELLGKACYSDVPWDNMKFLAPYSIKSRGGGLRMAFDLRQDEIRANASKINDTGSIISESKASEQEKFWREFASVDLPNASSAACDTKGQPVPLSIPIIQDMHFEQFRKSICVQKTLLVVSRTARNMLDELKMHLADTCHRRNTYEHSTLKLWANDIIAVTTEGAEPQLYYFDSPTDSSLDGIEWVSGTGCIDLREMVLPLTVTLEVAKDIYEVLAAGVDVKLSECPIVNCRIGEDSVSDVLCSVLVSAATLCVDRGVMLPQAWKQPSKLRAYAEGICGSLPVKNCPISLKDLIRYVIMRQVYGFVPTIPCSAYLSAVTKALAVDIADGPTKIPMQAFLFKLTCDPKLPAGWWEAPPSNLENSMSSLKKIKMRSSSRNTGRTGSLGTINNGTLSSASNISKTAPSIASYSGSYTGAEGDVEDLSSPKAGLWALECVAWTCIDSATADVDLIKVLHTLSMYPRDMLRCNEVVGKSIVSAADTEHAVEMHVMHPGLSRGLILFSQVQRIDYFVEHELHKLPCREKLSALLGPQLRASQISRLLDAVHLTSKNSKSDDTSVSSGHLNSERSIKTYEQFLYKVAPDGGIQFCRDTETPSESYLANSVVEHFTLFKNESRNLFDI